MNVLELFAGAGGAALGLKAAGWKSVGHVEFNHAACNTLRANGHENVIEGDVRDLDMIESQIAGDGVDAIWSSFPCQAWSSAGKRLGAADPRNGWPWTVDAIDRFKPEWFIGENVRGLTFHKKAAHADGVKVSPSECPGCYLEHVILSDLRSRFEHSGMFVLDAADYGVPQHRRRVILWGGPHAMCAPPGTHGNGSGRDYVSMFDAIGGIDGGFDRMMASGTTGQGRPTGVHEPSPTISTASNQYWTNRPSPTVVSSEQKGSGPGGRPEKMQRASDMLYLSTGRRRLTPGECSALQGFPSSYDFTGNKSEMYTQIGNAVPPKLAEVVARAVDAAKTGEL
jgi:DNA (cytosine-5)-methyltransferase 1